MPAVGFQAISGVLQVLFDRFDRSSGFLPCGEAAGNVRNVYQAQFIGDLNCESGSFADGTIKQNPAVFGESRQRATRPTILIKMSVWCVNRVGDRAVAAAFALFPDVYEMTVNRRPP